MHPARESHKDGFDRMRLSIAGAIERFITTSESVNEPFGYGVRPLES